MKLSRSKLLGLTAAGSVLFLALLRPCLAFFASLTVLLTLPALSVAHRLPVPRVIDLLIARIIDSFSFPTLLTPETLRKTAIKIFNPEGCHVSSDWLIAHSSSDGFFEGWYYKLVNRNSETIIVIPGVITGKKSKNGGYGFVMIACPEASAEQSCVRLLTYPLADVQSDSGPEGWFLTIGPNKFTQFSISLNTNEFNGVLELRSPVLWPTSLLMPDVMGFFAYFPGMECRHGVVVFHAKIDGELSVYGKLWSGQDGTAYVEKDWGSSFPTKWIWLQCSEFKRKAGSLQCPCSVSPSITFSVAPIPFPSSRCQMFAFQGFLGALWLPNETGEGTLIPFATYTGAVIEELETDGSGSKVKLVIRSACYRVEIEASGDRSKALMLYGPGQGGTFTPLVQEMLNVSFDICVSQRSTGAIIFEGHGVNGGLEIQGTDH